jgi:3-keto-5-aminohexanoate cleavage enzyme
MPINFNEKVIINAAITGCVLSKRDTLHLPVTVPEIVSCARQVQDAGAAIVHLHARNSDQTPCYESSVYCDLVGSIREACDDIIVCVSLSGRFVTDIQQRAAALASHPDMASLTLGSMNFATQASVNSPGAIQQLAGLIYASGAIPELEVFEAGFINYANYLIKKGHLHPPYYFNLILGSLGAAPLDLVGLGNMIQMLPAASIWSVGGIGQNQLDANVISLAAGGHIRVGLEDALFFDRKKEDLADNLRLVRRISQIAREMGRTPANGDEARNIIGLPCRPAFT